MLWSKLRPFYGSSGSGSSSSTPAWQLEFHVAAVALGKLLTAVVESAGPSAVPSDFQVYLTGFVLPTLKPAWPQQQQQQGGIPQLGLQGACWGNTDGQQQQQVGSSCPNVSCESDEAAASVGSSTAGTQAQDKQQQQQQQQKNKQQQKQKQKQQQPGVQKGEDDLDALLVSLLADDAAAAPSSSKAAASKKKKETAAQKEAKKQQKLRLQRLQEQQQQQDHSSS
jgi:hypothetical protein